MHSDPAVGDPNVEICVSDASRRTLRGRVECPLASSHGPTWQRHVSMHLSGVAVLESRYHFGSLCYVNCDASPAKRSLPISANEVNGDATCAAPLGCLIILSTQTLAAITSTVARVRPHKSARESMAGPFGRRGSRGRGRDCCGGATMLEQHHPAALHRMRCHHLCMRRGASSSLTRGHLGDAHHEGFRVDGTLQVSTRHRIPTE
jgi:hypothetical protein